MQHGNSCLANVWVFISIGNIPDKKSTAIGGAFFIGGDYGTRTCDLMRVKHAL